MSEFIINPYAFDALPLSVTYVGVESGVAANGYSVQNWSNPSVSKLYSIGGSNLYGTAGYYQIRPVTPFDAGYSIQFGEPAPANNDLGISAASYPTLYSHPAFATTVGSAGTYVNYGPYPIYRAPNGVDLVRQGSLSVPSNIQGDFAMSSFSGYRGHFFTITLTQSAAFRLGVVVDAVSDPAYAPVSLSIYNATLGQVDSSSDALPNDGQSDIVVFDISGNENDVFEIWPWQFEGQQIVTAAGLLTFDLL
jgi:hypothetical protein